MIAFALTTTLKVTLIFAAAGILTWLLRRSAASLRHLIWSLALGSALMLPALALLLPQMKVPALGRLLRAPASAQETRVLKEAGRRSWALNESAASRDAAATMVEESPSPAAQAMHSVPGSSTQRLPLGLGLFLVWLAGALLVLARMMLGIARMRRIARASRVVREGRLIRAIEEASGILGLGRRVILLQAAGPIVPMTWGALRPRILLPAEADAWPDEQLRAVLLHELAHVRRHDYLTQLVARLACAIYWFNPVVWVAAARLRHERELACDDQVLRGGSRASDYAGYLLEVARMLKSMPLASEGGVAMARSSKLGDRMRVLLDANRERRSLGRRHVLPTWLGATLLVVPIAAAAADPEASPFPKRDEPVSPGGIVKADEGASAEALPELWLKVEEADGAAEAAVVTLTTPPPRATEPEATLCDWTRPAQGRHSSSIEINDDRKIKALIKRADCELTIKISGAFKVNAAETAVIDLVRGGRFEIEEREGRESRRIRIENDGDGDLSRRWYINGKQREYDAEAQAWLGEMLPAMFRITGIDAEARARRIASTQGTDGLLREISLITSDHAAGKYYAVLLTQPDLDSADYERILTQASREISSDHTLAMLLIAIAENPAMDERAVQIAYVRASGSLSSDHEQGRVLNAMLSRPNLSQEAAGELLQKATEISSDHELARLLTNFIKTHPLAEALTPAFFAAVRTLGSDHEQRRVLEAVLERGAPSQAVLDQTLAVARDISSDHELATLLKGVADRYPVERALPASYLAAAQSISSDHELRAVLSSLVTRGRLSPESQVALLETAASIGSDFELGRLLVRYVEEYGLSDATRATFFRVAGTIDSDHERLKVLSAVVELTELTEADVLGVLGSAMRIGSDHSVTRLLVEVAEAYNIEGDIREAYIRVAESVSTEHQRNKALAALVVN